MFRCWNTNAVLQLGGGATARRIPTHQTQGAKQRVRPILMAAAIGAAISTAAFAQTGPGSNQPPGQATTTQSSEQKMDASGKPIKQQKAKKKKMKQ